MQWAYNIDVHFTISVRQCGQGATRPRCWETPDRQIGLPLRCITEVSEGSLCVAEALKMSPLIPPILTTIFLMHIVIV